MEQRFVSAYNESSKRFLGSSLAVVDSEREPIKVLKILMEGLAPEDEAGLWLINFRGVPIARSHTPFDLAFLDEDNRIIQAVEITQTSRFVPFKGSPASALILPPRALSASGTFTGDHIDFRDVQVSESDRPHPHPHAQGGAGIFSRIVRATMVKNYNVPDDQAAAAPRSGPLMRSARSLSIKPPKPTAEELEHERLAARVAAATAVTPAAAPPTVQWVPRAVPGGTPVPEPPAPPQEAAPPPALPATPPPVLEPLQEPEREPHFAAQTPSVAEEPPVPTPVALPLELEATRDDIAPEAEPEPEPAYGSSSIESPLEQAAAPPEFAAPRFTQPAPPESFEPPQAASLEERAFQASESFTPPPVIDPEETRELPADFASAQSGSLSPAGHEESAESIAPPEPIAEEPQQPQFDIEDFRRAMASRPAPPETPAPAQLESITSAPRADESRPEPQYAEEHPDELPAPVYAWNEPSVAPTPAPPATPAPANADSESAPATEQEEDPVSRDVAILISSNVAIAAELPFVVLAMPQSVLYSSQIETAREDEDEELEKRELGESLYLRTVERKPVTPPIELSPRSKWEPEYLKRALGSDTETKPTPSEPERPQSPSASEQQTKSAAAPDAAAPAPIFDFFARPARVPSHPQRIARAGDDQPTTPARPVPSSPASRSSAPRPAAPSQSAASTPPAVPRTRPSQPTVTEPVRPSTNRPRFVEPELPAQSVSPPQPKTALVYEAPPPATGRRHATVVGPESSHVAQQAPAHPTPPPPETATKMAKRWDVKLLYSLFPDLRPDYRPELEQPVVNFTRDAGRTHEETQTRRMKALNWLYPDLHLDTVKKRQREVRRAPRIPVPGLVGYFFTGGKSEAHEILNISVMGFYMKTTQRWMPGTVIRVTLQMIDSDGTNPSDSITVLSRVVNWDNDGGGFEFVLPGLID